MVAKGVKYLRDYRKDTTLVLTPKQAIQAFCADCMGEFEDKVMDCQNIRCPLYQHMYYRKDTKSEEL